MDFKSGDVFQFQLPNGMYAYGRSIDGCLIGFCRELSNKPNTLPKNMNDCFFKIWFQTNDEQDKMHPIIANVPLRTEEEKKIPLMGGENPLFGYAIFENEEFRKATKEECEGLEPTAQFPLKEVIERIMGILEDEHKN